MAGFWSLSVTDMHVQGQKHFLIGANCNSKLSVLSDLPLTLNLDAAMQTTVLRNYASVFLNTSCRGIHCFSSNTSHPGFGSLSTICLESRHSKCWLQNLVKKKFSRVRLSANDAKLLLHKAQPY